MELPRPPQQLPAVSLLPVPQVPISRPYMLHAVSLAESTPVRSSQRGRQAIVPIGATPDAAIPLVRRGRREAVGAGVRTLGVTSPGSFAPTEGVESASARAVAADQELLKNLWIDDDDVTSCRRKRTGVWS